MARSLSSGRRIHALKLQKPFGEKVPDGDGDYESDFRTYQEVFGSVEPATASRLEKLTASGAVGVGTHIVTIPFIQGVELKQRVIYSGRRLDVIGYADPEERHIELILVCQELKA